MLPLVWMSHQVTKCLGKDDEGQYIRQEMSAMAKMGRESGELDEQESKILTQMLSVKEMPVTAIMTPRTVMFSLPSSMTQEAFALSTKPHHFLAFRSLMKILMTLLVTSAATKFYWLNG